MRRPIDRPMLVMAYATRRVLDHSGPSLSMDRAMTPCSISHPTLWRRALAPAFGVLLVAAMAAPAVAQPKKPPAKAQPAQTLPVPKSLGSFDAWTAVELAQPDSKICYMFARPAASEPKAVKRSEVMLTITHRPANKRFDEVSFQAGYPFKAGAPVAVDIDGKKFEFFTRPDVDADSAWAKDAAADKTVVAAMKAGKTFKVKGTSSKNTQVADTFSLGGFGKAYAEIGKACGVK